MSEAITRHAVMVRLCLDLDRAAGKRRFTS